MYMGGIKAFQKNGKGILLHDNGTNGVSSYYNDLLHGHNIFFTNSCLLSGEYSKNKLTEAVYRTDGFILIAFYNSDGQLDGKITLLNYITRSILYCTYKKGLMIQKDE
jgi:antitoxin component YwqK of YwqJK toxin-antitoxin module